MNILDVKKLKNGVVLTCYDDSQTIVGDRCMVKIRFAIVIPWSEWMDNVLEDEGVAPAMVQNDVGDLALEIIKERIFVDQIKKDDIAEEIIAEMQENILAYLDHPSFIERFFRRHLLEVHEKLKHAGPILEDEDEDDDDGPADFSACFK